MFDIWGFLLQTLNVSAVGAVLLLIKAMFRDKLPPKWQFAVWSVLGIMLLLPAGFLGRYAVFHWPLVVEIIKTFFGDYSYTRVLFPIPIIKSVPQTVGEWIFVGYVLGVVVSIIKYAVSYIRLRLVLRKGNVPDGEIVERVQMLAGEQKVKLRKAIEVEGLPSAFVCGMFHPVLVFPKEQEVDDKIILHELLHLKYKDTFWSVVICFWRCIHCCNPFLGYCANQAINDMEARCDQHVLELLEGEERRDYGRILLSMANEKYAKTPGSTCINNGGKNIRERIEAIARFKKYPVGMRLVSVCVIVLLVLFMGVGVQETEAYEFDNSLEWSMASARSIPCTTLAGALDTYGKAILERNGAYRAMCAPQSMQESLMEEMSYNHEMGIYLEWNNGIVENWANPQEGYWIYNLKMVEENVYEALLVVELLYSLEGIPRTEETIYVAYQNLQARQENGRWVVIPMDEFQYLAVDEIYSDLKWGCGELPGYVYTGTAENFQVNINCQTVHAVDNTVQSETYNWPFGSSSHFDTTPKPNAEFSVEYYSYEKWCTHLGTQEERDAITQVGLSVASVYEGEERPKFLKGAYGGTSGSGGSSDGTSWAGKYLDTGWGPTVRLGGGGSSSTPEMSEKNLPVSYAANLFVNNKLVEEMDLYLQEGVE